MRLLILLIICQLVLVASTCQKEDINCHYSFHVINASDHAVVCAIKAYFGGVESCNLSGEILIANEKKEFSLTQMCWEDELSNGRTQEVYIVDSNHFNDENVFYDCDSIEEYNGVLKYYNLSLEDLQQLNWAITYP